MLTNKMPKNAKKYYCEKCDFKCSKESNFIQHLSTRKHEILTNTDTKEPKNAKAFQCECGKSYKHRQSLHQHKKRCNGLIENTIVKRDDSIDYKEMFYRTMDEFRDERTDLMDRLNKQQEIMENIIDNVGTTNITNNNTNNNVNINMFLNEQCKNAVNFTDFIEGIEVSHDDLENNAELGFVGGISKILMDNLNQLTLYERPIHCTDVKRDTLYIKDENTWEKEESITKLQKAINEVSRKSVLSLLDWKKTNPDYQDLDSDFSKKCIPMQKNSTALCNKDAFYSKIIKNLAKDNTIKDYKNKF